MRMTLKFLRIRRDLRDQPFAEIRRIAAVVVVGNIISASKAIDY